MQPPPHATDKINSRRMENLITKNRDFPGGPVAKTLLPVQKPWVLSLVRDLDPHAATKSSRAATKDTVCYN